MRTLLRTIEHGHRISVCMIAQRWYLQLIKFYVDFEEGSLVGG